LPESGPKVEVAHKYNVREALGDAEHLLLLFWRPPVTEVGDHTSKVLRPR
jgi:hypothetical protein